MTPSTPPFPPRHPPLPAQSDARIAAATLRSAWIPAARTQSDASIVSRGRVGVPPHELLPDVLLSPILLRHAYILDDYPTCAVLEILSSARNQMHHPLACHQLETKFASSPALTGDRVEDFQLLVEPTHAGHSPDALHLKLAPQVADGGDLPVLWRANWVPWQRRLC